MRLFIFLLSNILFFSQFSQAQSPISCAFCLAGIAQMNQQIVSTPDMQVQMGIQASQGCDQIPVQQTRQACRETLNTNFNLFYGNFSIQASNSPNQMCINMGMC